MSKPKLTPWFSGSVKPVRPGVYQRVNGYYSLWNGSRWMFPADDAKDAATRHEGAESMEQVMQWRGLAEEPK